MDVKQVIVMRTKYPDGKGGFLSLRKGKLIAQGAHAAMMWLINRLGLKDSSYTIPIYLSVEEQEWINGLFTKVTLQVETEEELLEIFNKARAKGFTTYMITDSGKTEFNGVPTNTCVCIGPHEVSKIDEVTGSLKLY